MINGLAAVVVVGEEASVSAAGVVSAVESAGTVCIANVLPLESTSTC